MTGSLVPSSALHALLFTAVSLLIHFMHQSPACLGGVGPRPPCAPAVFDTLAGSQRGSLLQAAPSRGGRTLSVVPAGIRFGRGELREPLALSIDARGCLFVADAMTGKVFRYSEGGESIEFEKPSRSASLYPIDIAAYGSYVYVLDYADNRIVRYDRLGAYLDVLLSFGKFGKVRPVSLTVSEGGGLVTTDVENHSCTVWTPLLDVELDIGGFGWSDGRLDRPMKAIVLHDARIAVVEAGNRRVQVFTATGDFERYLQPPAGTQFRSPRSIATDAAGNVFVADTQQGTIFVFSPSGEFLLTVDSYAGVVISPASLAVGWNDFLYVADLHSRSILVYRLLYPS